MCLPNGTQFFRFHTFPLKSVHIRGRCPPTGNPRFTTVNRLLVCSRWQPWREKSHAFWLQKSDGSLWEMFWREIGYPVLSFCIAGHWRIYIQNCLAHAPYGTQFFRFRILFHQKASASEVHAPQNGSKPPYGKSWICPCRGCV